MIDGGAAPPLFRFWRTRGRDRAAGRAMIGARSHHGIGVPPLPETNMNGSSDHPATDPRAIRKKLIKRFGGEFRMKARRRFSLAGGRALSFTPEILQAA